MFAHNLEEVAKAASISLVRVGDDTRVRLNENDADKASVRTGDTVELNGTRAAELLRYGGWSVSSKSSSSAKPGVVIAAKAAQGNEPPKRKSLNKMNKAELTALAAELGLEAVEGETNEELAIRITEAAEAADEAAKAAQGNE